MFFKTNQQKTKVIAIKDEEELIKVANKMKEAKEQVEPKKAEKEKE